MEQIRLTISKPTVVNRFSRVQKARKNKNPRLAGVVRELAEERAKQIEDFGDVPMMPANIPVAGKSY